jgi:GT2 family glycosyltransferase
MSNRPDFLLIILSYNHPQITARCVSSALKHLPSEKIILAHNGSDIIHSETLKNQFHNIEHWEFYPNKGYSGGVNAALEMAFANTDWVFILTNDTEISSWSLQTEKLAEGLYSPVVWQKEKKGIDYVGGIFDSRSGKLIHLKESHAVSKPGCFAYIPGTAFLISKKVFNSLGPLDESLHTYWEDVDFGARASKAGIQFGLLKDIEIIHYGRKTTRKNPYYSNYLFRRNKLRVSWRHCPWYYKPQLAMKLIPDAVKVLRSQLVRYPPH